MKIIICGGGTAGHIYPGLALAEALKALDASSDILFVGSRKGLEADLVPEYGYPFEVLDVTAVERKVSAKAVAGLARVGCSFVAAVFMLRRLRPDVVVGTGGYVSFPVVRAASVLRMPTVIQEQNAVPGLANRQLARRARLVALTYAESRKYFPSSANMHVVANPIRSSILAVDRGESLRRLELEDGRTTILAFGGSRGARQLNEAIVDAYEDYRNRDDLQIVHITGKMEFEAVTGRLAKAQRSGDKVVYRCYPYMEDLSKAYAAADLVVSRAGAGTLAEITARGLPSVLIPYPHATDDHQTQNALVLERLGAARLVSDDSLGGGALWRAMSEFIDHPSDLRAAADRSAKAGKPSAAHDLARIILDNFSALSHAKGNKIISDNTEGQ